MGLSKVWIIPFLSFFFSVSAFFISYGIALIGKHVDLENWPYISDSGNEPPESCVFSQLLNVAALFLACTIYLRHRQIVEFYWHQHQQEGKWRAMSCFLLFLGYSSSLGVSMVGNFQKNHKFMKPVHYAGALLAFGCGLLYAWAQTIFSYMMNPKLAKPIVSHCRLILTVLATLFFTLMFTFGILAHNLNPDGCNKPSTECNEEATYKIFRTIATSSEWSLALCFLFYILSFAIELRHAYCHAPKLRLIAYFKNSESDISVKSSKPITCCSGFTTKENKIETYEIPKCQFYDTNFLNLDYFEKQKNFENFPIGLETADFVDPARLSAFDQSIDPMRF
uniref:DNA damage-regulated autophagy modulator protein 2 n=1 Tax=Panagrolaimus sp. JU765 TaxID=591449 RepID=A0AC34RK67_9BILA